jgi:uncharacterized protein (TIGR03086 family)
MDTVAALARAYAMADPVVAAVTSADYLRPTPCREWDVESLLNHLIQVVGQFPVVLAGGKGDWGGRAFIDDPSAAWHVAVEANLTAWRVPGAAETPGRQPGTYLIELNLTDTVTHTWDLARAIEHPLAVDTELVAFVLELCADAPFLRDRSHAFGPEMPVDPDAPPLDRLAGLLGRQP